MFKWIMCKVEVQSFCERLHFVYLLMHINYTHKIVICMMRKLRNKPLKIMYLFSPNMVSGLHYIY